MKQANWRGFLMGEANCSSAIMQLRLWRGFLFSVSLCERYKNHDKAVKFRLRCGAGSKTVTMPVSKHFFEIGFIKKEIGSER
jgi:hypothetical protein